MPLYERPVRELIRDAARELGMTDDRPVSRKAVVDWFASRYPRIKQATVTAHLMRHSVNAPSRIHHTIRPDGSDDLFFQVDSSSYRLYNPALDPAPIRPAGRSATADGQEAQPEQDDQDQDPATASEFAYERDLRNYLARHLDALESGLRLYEDEDVRGVEFPAGGRFIDLLCVDAGGRLVVVELKVSRGYDRVVGQLLRYMAWIQQNLAEPTQPVRGFIIAKSISEDLKMASSRDAGIQLFEYDLVVEVRRVK